MIQQIKSKHSYLKLSQLYFSDMSNIKYQEYKLFVTN